MILDEWVSWIAPFDLWMIFGIGAVMLLQFYSSTAKTQFKEM
jgi:hypothetical protein